MIIRSIKRSSLGFTIVELLIVIVVITVLAAISVISYNTVNKNSKTGAGQSTASSVKIKIDAYLVAANVYPTGGLTASSLSGYTESKIDDSSSLIAATSATVPALTSITARDGQTVSAWGCAAGANIWYWDYTAAAVVKITSGNGC